MSAASPYDITNEEQLRRIGERFDAQDKRIALIEGRTTALESTVERLNKTVGQLDGTVERFAGFVNLLTATFGWLKKGRVKIAAALGIVGIPLADNVLRALFHHWGWN